MDNLLSVSLDLPVVDISSKWSHIICGLLGPILLLSITFSRLIHVVLSLISSFLLIVNIPLYGYTTLFIHSSAEEHLGFHFGLLWVTLLWTFMNKFLCGHLFKFSVYISRDRIAGSYGNSMFNHLSNCQAVFQSDCTIWYSHQQGMNVPISPHLHQLLLLSVFFITAILVGVNSWFCCVFPWWKMMLRISSCIYGASVYHLWINVCLSPWPIVFTGLTLLSDKTYVFQIQILYDLQKFLSIGWVVFSLS